MKRIIIPGHNIKWGGLQMEKYGRYVYIIILATSLLVLFSGCGVKTAQQPVPIKAEIVRKADWEIEFRDVFFLDTEHGWVIGEEGTILYTEDSGKNWKTQKSGTEARLNKMQFIDERRGWIVGNDGTFLRTKNSGKKWEKQIVRDGSMSLISLHFLDEQRGWITGEGGALYYTAVSYTHLTLPTNREV